MWSGGFDSTYLLVRRLLNGDRVEAVYATQDFSWQKQIREMEAQRRILHDIPKLLRSRLIIPSKFEHMDESIWKRYHELNAEHIWISKEVSQQTAIFPAMTQKYSIEVGLVSSDLTVKDPLAVKFLKDRQVLLPIENMTKIQILKDSRSRGFDHLLNLTWSCEGMNEEALHGPCGVCEPCKHRIINYGK